MQDYLYNNAYDVNRAIGATGGGYQLPYSSSRIQQESMARQQNESSGGLSLSNIGQSVMDYYGSQQQAPAAQQSQPTTDAAAESHARFAPEERTEDGTEDEGLLGGGIPGVVNLIGGLLF